MGSQEKSRQEQHVTEETSREKAEYNVSITGDISGQVAIGHHISQSYTRTSRTLVTPEELATLKALLADVRAQVADQAPPELREAALERVDELAEAIVAEEPDLTTMEYVKKWFAKHIPTLAGTITSVIVHPIVGKLVEAAGDVLAAEFRRRFGGTQPS